MTRWVVVDCASVCYNLLNLKRIDAHVGGGQFETRKAYRSSHEHRGARTIEHSSLGFLGFANHKGQGVACANV